VILSTQTEEKNGKTKSPPLQFRPPMFELPTLSFGKKKMSAVGHLYHPVCLTCEPDSSTFLSEQTSHQQSASSTFRSEQICTSHQPPAKRTRCASPDPRSTPQILGGSNIGGGGLQVVGAEASACLHAVALTSRGTRRHGLPVVRGQ
jgi:hypothetical protein